MRAGLALCVVLGLGHVAWASPCREECLRNRAKRKRQLEDCLQEAGKAPPRLRPEARLECRRRAVIPSCKGRPPCPEGKRPEANIDILTHYFSSSEHGRPMRAAVFAPGQTVFLRYQGIVVPEPTSREVRLRGDVLLRQGKQVLARRDKDLQMKRRVKEEDYPSIQKFGGRASFKLSPDLKPGEYAIELRLRDAGSQTEAIRGYRFRVESRPSSRSAR